MSNLEDYRDGGRLTTLVSQPLQRSHSFEEEVRISTEARVQASENLLLDYSKVLWRRRKTILLLALLGGVVGFAATVWKLPVYRARTSLDIQNLNADFMNRRAIDPTGDGGSASQEEYVQTQIKLLQSDTLRTRTVNRMKQSGLAASLERGDMLSQIRQRLGLGADRSLSPDELLQFAAKNVTVKPLGLTRLVEITCDSWDPKLSAAFCNTLTTEFAAQDREVRWNEAQKTGEWLSRQVADIREGLDASQKKLADATGEDALMLSQEGATVAEERLRDLQTELMKAQADRYVKESQFDISRSASATSVPAVLDSSIYREEQTKLSDLQRQLAAMVPGFTEANPKVQHLRAQVAEVESNLTALRTNTIDRLQNEYDAAKQREAMLAAAYGRQERIVGQEASRQNQVSTLRHEVDSSQQLYQTLLQRVKEAGFASAMQASNIRIVDAAMAPTIPISPRHTASGLMGLLIGLLLGVCTAFLRERTQTALRAPGDVTRYLHLRELGVIPSMRSSEFRRLTPVTRVAPVPTNRLLTGPAAAPTGKSEHYAGLANRTSRTSLLAEAYRNATYSVLRTSKPGSPAKVYVISSPGVGDGKTTVTYNLGIALAQANRRVLLIDGDLRRPKLHKAANIDNNVGLRDMLREHQDREHLDGERSQETVKDEASKEASSAPRSFYRATEVENLFVLPTGKGKEEPSTLLHSAAMGQLIQKVSGEFDIILIDTPPVIHITDARILAGISNGVILVFRAHSTARDSAITARDLFLHDDVEVVGTILNDFDPAREGHNAYYSSYYDYATDGGKPAGAAESA